jgi:nucleoside 2-deoxyribosyltransferase
LSNTGSDLSLRTAQKRKVFISGPIQGMEYRQTYRRTLKRILYADGYEVLDPWEREKIIYPSDEPEWWKSVPSKGFIRRDLEDIKKCDLFVAYLPKLSAGSCMELFEAKRIGKKTVVISRLKNPSPWIVAHADRIVSSFKEFKSLFAARN